MQNKENERNEEEIWVTYKDETGKVKSAPLEIFKKIAKESGWEPKPLLEKDNKKN